MISFLDLLTCLCSSVSGAERRRGLAPVERELGLSSAIVSWFGGNMNSAVKSVDARMLSIPNSNQAWVLCRPDYVKGVFIPLAELPPPLIKRERSETEPKSESSVDPHPNPVVSLASQPAKPARPSLTIDPTVIDWTPKEDTKLKEGVSKLGKNWDKIANGINRTVFEDREVRTAEECKERWSQLSARTEEVGVRKGKWSKPEIAKLLEMWLLCDGEWGAIAKSINRGVAACKTRFKQITSDLRKDSSLHFASVSDLVIHAQSLYSS